MPELPDVEIQRRYLAATALHRRIERVKTFGERVLRGNTPASFGRRVHGCTFEASKRHGKWLLAHLDTAGVAAFHFGMTGRLCASRKRTPPHEHAQLRFRFADGGALDYVATRKLGAVELASTVEDFVEREQLGPDARAMSVDAFRDRIASKRGTIKGALTDQTTIAGLGNVYADEILFQAGIHPKATPSQLSDARLRRLQGAMRDVLETAVACHADPESMPDGYLLTRREEGAPCPNCTGKVASYRVGGRRGYYCPRCQQR